MNKSGIRKTFCVSVSLLLILSATAKLTAVGQQKAFLQLPDPVFTSMTVKSSMIVAVALEVFVAFFVIRKRNCLSAMVACSWLVSIFVCYRLLEKAFFAKKPCHCLGGVLDWTRLPQNVLDLIPVVILCYVGIGSLTFLAMEGSSVRYSQKNG